MVSLNEEKAKRLTQVLSNDTARKILDYLTRHDNLTESEVASELGLSLSTVHYNIQQLVLVGLVKSDEFHYSPKGKEVNHYSLVNKYIVIAPKSEENLLSKLKDMIPTFFTVVAVVGIARMVWSFMPFEQIASDTLVAPEAARVMDAAVQEAVMLKAPQSTNFAPVEHAMLSPNEVLLWFSLGAVFALCVYMVWSWLRTKRGKLVK